VCFCVEGACTWCVEFVCELCVCVCVDGVCLEGGCVC